ADLSIARSLGKPFYVGENGIGASDLGPACDTQARADLFSQKIAASFAAGAIGYLPWAFSYTQEAGVCSYNFGPNSPVMQIFRRADDSQPVCTTQAKERVREGAGVPDVSHGYIAGDGAS